MLKSENSKDRNLIFCIATVPPLSNLSIFPAQTKHCFLFIVLCLVTFPAILTTANEIELVLIFHVIAAGAFQG